MAGLSCKLCQSRLVYSPRSLSHTVERSLVARKQCRYRGRPRSRVFAGVDESKEQEQQQKAQSSDESGAI